MITRQGRDNVAAAWAAEIERRVRELSSGVPAQTVFDEGRQRIRQLSRDRR